MRLGNFCADFAVFISNKSLGDIFNIFAIKSIFLSVKLASPVSIVERYAVLKPVNSANFSCIRLLLYLYHLVFNPTIALEFNFKHLPRFSC